MQEIQATTAYFIKLGRGGEWEEECILRDKTIKLGFNNPLHSECLAGEWYKIHEYWMGQGKKKGALWDFAGKGHIWGYSN